MTRYLRYLAVACTTAGIVTCWVTMGIFDALVGSAFFVCLLSLAIPLRGRR